LLIGRAGRRAASPAMAGELTTFTDRPSCRRRHSISVPACPSTVLHSR